MPKQKFYEKLADALAQPGVTPEELEAKFPDPRQLAEEDDMWDARDVCFHYEIDSYNTYHLIDTVIGNYVRA